MKAGVLTSSVTVSGPALGEGVPDAAANASVFELLEEVAEASVAAAAAVDLEAGEAEGEDVEDSEAWKPSCQRLVKKA